MDLTHQICSIHKKPFNLIISLNNSFALTCRFCKEEHENDTKHGVLLNQSGKMFFVEWTRLLLDLLQSWGAQAMIKEIILPFKLISSTKTIDIMGEAIERQVNMFNNNLNYVCSNEMENLTEHMFVVDYYNMAIGTADYSLTYLLNNFKALLGENEGTDIHFKPSFVEYLSERRMSILSKFPKTIYSQSIPLEKFKEPYQDNVESVSEEMDEHIPEDRDHRKVITLRKSFIIKPLKNEDKLNLKPRQSISPHRIQVISGNLKSNNYENCFQTPKNEGSIKRTRQIFNSQKGNHCKTEESQMNICSNQKYTNESTIYTKKPLESIHGERQNNEFSRNNRLNSNNNLKLSVSEFFEKELHLSPQSKKTNRLSSLSKIVEDIHIENKKLQEWKDDMADHVKELGTKIEEINVVRESFKENRDRLKEIKEDEKSFIDELSDHCKEKVKPIETSVYPVQTDFETPINQEEQKLKEKIELISQMQKLSESQNNEKKGIIKKLELNELSLRQKLEEKEREVSYVDEQILKQNEYVHELNKVNLNYLELIKTKNSQFEAMEIKLSAMQKQISSLENHKNKNQTFSKQIQWHHFNEDSRKGLASAQSYLTELLQKNSELKSEIEYLEVEKKGCVQAMDLLKSQMKESNEKLKEVELKVKNSEFYNQSFQDVIRLQEKTIFNLEEQLQTKDKMISSLEIIVQSNLNEIEEFNKKRDQEISVKEGGHHKTDETISCQHKKIESLIGELEEIKSRYLDQSKEVTELREKEHNHKESLELSESNVIKNELEIKKKEEKIGMTEDLLMKERMLKEQVEIKLEEELSLSKSKDQELNEKQEKILSLEANETELKKYIQAQSQELQEQTHILTSIQNNNKQIEQCLLSEKEENFKLIETVKKLQESVSKGSFDEQLAEELVLAEVELKSKELELQELNKLCKKILNAVDEDKRGQFCEDFERIIKQ